VAKVVDANLFITNVTVIDVASGKAKSGLTVAVKGNQIVAVSPASEIAPAKDVKMIDGTGKYLIPGLWDMHVHLFDASYRDWFLRYGVTGVRHMYTAQPFTTYSKQDKPDGPIHPRYVLANMMLDGEESAFKNALATNLWTAKDAKTAEAAVREIKKAGNDFLKVHAMLPREAYFAAVKEAKMQGMVVAGHVPFSITAAEASDAGQYTIEHLNGVAVVCSSREKQHLAQLRDKGMRGIGLNATTGWRVDVEAHENFDQKKADELFAKFAKNGTWHVPTLVQTRQMARLGDTDALPADIEKQLPEALRVLWKREITERAALPFPLSAALQVVGKREITPERVELRFPLSIKFTRQDLKDRTALLEGDLKLVRAMHKAGVRLLAGTDTTAPLVVPGFALHEELALLVKAGLTPAVALQSATLGPAQCLKMDDRLGTIEAGKLADLVLLSKNPLDDISNTRSIEVVIAGGRVVPP
jgi:imidazolonepropionase-like amidohydrolase